MNHLPGSLAFYFLLLLLAPICARAITVEITASVPGCGDGVIGPGEQCDGSNLGGSSCSTLGFSSGTLACSSACTWNTSSCTLSGGGGGGGGSGGGSSSSPNIPSTNVVFTGRAYPRSVVTLLKDAKVVATTVAGTDSNFQVTISGVSGGNYIFSVYSEDQKGIRSALLTFPVSVTSGVTTKVSGIFIAPTIAVDKKEVRKGDNISIFGQSAPASEIIVSINSEEEIFIKGAADASGAYLLNFDTSVLEIGEHSTKSKASLNGEITSYGKAAEFIVGTQNVPAAAAAQTSSLLGDLNGDKRINIIDFSMLAYWYKRLLPPPTHDLNRDGKIDLTDLSIMVFNWTG